MSRYPWLTFCACSLIVLVAVAPRAAASGPVLSLSVSEADASIGDTVSVLVVSYLVGADNATAPSPGPVNMTATTSAGVAYAPLTGLFSLNGGAVLKSVRLGNDTDFDRLFVQARDLTTNATGSATITVAPTWTWVRQWTAQRDANLSDTLARAIAAQDAAETERMSWVLGILVASVVLFELYRLDRRWRATRDFTLRDRFGYFLHFSRGVISDPIMRILADESKVPDVKWGLEKDLLWAKAEGLREDAARLGAWAEKVRAHAEDVPNADKFLLRVARRLKEIAEELKETDARVADLTANIATERKKDHLAPEWGNGRNPNG